MEITTLPTFGALRLAGQPLAAGQLVTVADLLNGKLTIFLPPDGVRASRPSFTFQVEDSGSTANGGLALDPTPKTLAFNTAPVANDMCYTIAPNSVLDQSMDVTHLELAGYWIGDGLTYDSDNNDGDFSTYGNGSVATISYRLGNEYWDLSFAAPNGAKLVPGTYTVPENNYSTTNPWFDVSGDGHFFWNFAYGQFTVNQVVFGASGDTGAVRCHDFEEFPGGGSAAVSGRVQYHSVGNGCRRGFEQCFRRGQRSADGCPRQRTTARYFDLRSFRWF